MIHGISGLSHADAKAKNERRVVKAVFEDIH